MKIDFTNIKIDTQGSEVKILEEIYNSDFINNISKVICNDSQIIFYKNKREKQKITYKFSPEKTDDGYIKISEKLNK